MAHRLHAPTLDKFSGKEKTMQETMATNEVTEGTLEGLSGKMLAQAGKHLTFRLAGESYGLEILKVQEIIGMMAITRVPQTSHFVRGVINLRGKVIPVIDLRLKLGLEAIETTSRTCIIVVQIQSSESVTTMGIIVDEVSEVVDIAQNQLEPAPEFGESALESDFLIGMGKIHDRVVMILDVDKLVLASEKNLMTIASEAA